MKTIPKISRSLKLLSHSSYLPDLASTEFYLHVKKMLSRKRLGSNKKGIAEIEASFAAKDNSFPPLILLMIFE